MQSHPLKPGLVGLHAEGPQRIQEAQRPADSVGSIPEPEEHALRGARVGAGQASLRQSKYPTRQRKAAQWEPKQGGVIFFSGTGFPVGHRAEVSGLQSLGRACLTG